MSPRVFIRGIMSQAVMKLMNNAETAEKRLLELRCKLEEVKKFKIQEKIIALTQENKVLASNVEHAKNELIKLELKNGKKQYTIPGQPGMIPVAAKETVSLTSEVQEVKIGKDSNKKEKKDKEPSKKNKEKQSDPTCDIVDVRKLDFRIGKIIDINKHPDADTLYVEKIDCGEDNPRTVVSGLVNHVPIEEMRNRIVMILCNLKPVKMRGVTSEAMVMCASSPEKVEVLVPPADALPGDLVSCEGYPREPEAQLNPKKKIFETCAPDLKTNTNKVACYKGSPLIVPGKGAVVAPTLKEVSVK